MFFNENVALFHVEAKTDEEVIRIGADELLKRGIVKDTFFENVLKREREYPTGLATDSINVAIPHTVSAHVNRSQILFLSLKEPVHFTAMDDDSVKVPVSLVFMIAMANQHEQVDTLNALMGMLQKPEALEELLKCNTVEEFKAVVNKNGLE